jgi:hypothetical protein
MQIAMAIGGPGDQAYIGQVRIIYTHLSLTCLNTVAQYVFTRQGRTTKQS